jgi:FAD/FMN-containing dehydrogenase
MHNPEAETAQRGRQMEDDVAQTTLETHLPDPVRRSSHRAADAVDAEALERDLVRGVDGEVRFDAGSRSAYSTDASNYREVPIGVVVPRSIEAAVDAIAICRRHGSPLLSRGGGTSLAGQCTNRAVVIDWSKYCNALVSVDVDRRRCVVEPGIVLDHLNDLLADTGLEYGPRPATHNHCTLGGMIGNNSCGATAQRTGKVVDNVARLEVLLYDGTRMWVGPTSDEDYERIVSEGGRRAEVHQQLRALADHYGGEIRNRYPEIPRRVSGYNLDSLLPERGFDVAKALVGSEATLVTVLRAELRLVPQVAARTMLLLGYPDVASSADAVPDVLTCDPIALEGLDHTLVELQRKEHLNPKALHLLPDGAAWLMVQLGGADQDEADRNADRLLEVLGRSRGDDDVAFFDEPGQEEELWDVREAALGATARIPGGPDTWPGWEDSAVDPADLGDYLRDLHGLYEEYGYEQASLYGHFGQGCVHTRIPFEMFTARGIEQFRSFLERAADLVSGYGGSLSGEHGDGQARGELLTRMFGSEIVRAFGQMKAIFDPFNLMNPGKVVDPAPLDERLRLGPDYHHAPQDTEFAYPDDDGDFGRAVLRCVGVGKCRRETGEVMCPSYMVTREEEHSTRGRARLLFEMLDGTARGGAIADGWRSSAVRDALDLCLSCKGCKSDCPANVDMATYKAEFLSHHYRHRLRPAAHYSMGWLPLWSGLAAATSPRLVNRISHAPGITSLAKRLAGVDARREIPWFAEQTLQQWHAGRHEHLGTGERGTVLIWPDTFTNHFHPSVGRAAVELLELAGSRPASVLRPHVAVHRPAPHGQAGAATHGVLAGRPRPQRRARRRARTELYGRVQERPGRAVPRRPRCEPPCRPDRHLVRTARPPHAGLDTPAHRSSSGRPDALSSARDHEEPRRPRDPRCDRRRGRRPRLGLLRARRKLRIRARAPRRVARVRRTGAAPCDPRL